VKFILEQAMKYSRGRRGISSLALRCKETTLHPMKLFDHVIVTSATAVLTLKKGAHCSDGARKDHLVCGDKYHPTKY
jgi:hypothetical protein